jgi:hypothetical protein
VEGRTLNLGSITRIFEWSGLLAGTPFTSSRPLEHKFSRRLRGARALEEAHTLLL